VDRQAKQTMASNKIDRLCANKDCVNIGKHLCSGCGEESYCSKECQKAHWAAHKSSCHSAVKPEAAIFLKSFDELSIKQLKNIMKAKAATFEGKKKSIVLTKLENMVEKPALVKLVQEHVETHEVEGLLSASTNTTTSSSSSASDSSSSSKRKSSSSSSNTNSAAGQQMPTPQQLKQQAKMMKEQPDMVRRANPMFAKMTNAQIIQYAEQMETVKKNICSNTYNH